MDVPLPVQQILSALPMLGFYNDRPGLLAVVSDVGAGLYRHPALWYCAWVIGPVYTG